jgi:hypothetical protein
MSVCKAESLQRGIIRVPRLMFMPGRIRRSSLAGALRTQVDIPSYHQVTGSTLGHCLQNKPLLLRQSIPPGIVRKRQVVPTWRRPTP